jgi:hydrogenase maturation protease
VLTELLDGEHRFLAEAGSDRGAEVLASLGGAEATQDDLDASAQVTRDASAQMGRTLESFDLRDRPRGRRRGPLVAKGLHAAGAAVLDCDDEPTRLIDAWDGLELVVIVDALRSGAAPRTVPRFEAGVGALPRELGLASTHAFSIADTVELARALGRAPARVVVVGVEGAAFDLGDPLTPAVEAALPGAVEAVLAELDGRCTSGR